MKLLFDENLAPRLAVGLQDLFPESQHVRDAGLAGASDAEVWDYAKTRGFAIVSKDSDFQRIHRLRALTFPQAALSLNYDAVRPNERAATDRDALRVERQARDRRKGRLEVDELAVVWSVEERHSEDELGLYE